MDFNPPALKGFCEFSNRYRRRNNEKWEYIGVIICAFVLLLSPLKLDIPPIRSGLPFGSTHHLHFDEVGRPVLMHRGRDLIPRKLPLCPFSFLLSLSSFCNPESLFAIFLVFSHGKVFGVLDYLVSSLDGNILITNTGKVVRKQKKMDTPGERKRVLLYLPVYQYLWFSGSCQ